jgi:hypothetical protein
LVGYAGDRDWSLSGIPGAWAVAVRHTLKHPQKAAKPGTITSCANEVEYLRFICALSVAIYFSPTKKTYFLDIHYMPIMPIIENNRTVMVYYACAEHRFWKSFEKHFVDSPEFSSLSPILVVHEYAFFFFFNWTELKIRLITSRSRMEQKKQAKNHDNRDPRWSVVKFSSTSHRDVDCDPRERVRDDKCALLHRRKRLSINFQPRDTERPGGNRLACNALRASNTCDRSRSPTYPYSFPKRDETKTSKTVTITGVTWTFFFYGFVTSRFLFFFFFTRFRSVFTKDFFFRRINRVHRYRRPEHDDW